MRIALLGNPDSLHVRRWLGFLRGRGHALLLVADPHTRARPEGVEIAIPHWTILYNIAAFRLTPKPHGNSFWKPRLYRPLIAAFRPDVVHGFEAYYNGLATARSGPFPRVLSPWGRDIFFDARTPGLAGWMVRRALAGVDRITCNDPSIGPYLERELGVPAAKIRTFSWGADLTLFRPREQLEQEALRQRLDLNPASPILFSPRKWGRLWGSDRLAEALPRALAAVPGALAVLLGPAPGDAEGLVWKQALDRSPVGARLRWLDADQTPETMAGLFSVADLFVSAAPRDLLSSTVVEGMACGCLPVLTDLPAYAKYATHGETALLAGEGSADALADAMIRGLGDSALRARAAALNTERMRREEDASVNMLQMEDVYAESIAVFRAAHRR